MTGSRFSELLTKLGATRRGAEWVAKCPAHADESPSLSITEKEGKVLVKCRAGCPQEAVLEALRARGLWPEGRQGGGGGSTPRHPRATPQQSPGRSVAGAPQQAATVQHPPDDGAPPIGEATPPDGQGLTLERYAEAKGLPVDFLRGLGLTTVYFRDGPGVRIPYLAPDGTTEAAVRFRHRLEKAEGGDGRFSWRKGSKLLPYGLERLEEGHRAGYTTLAEGESDPQTLWRCGEPALGLPGADTWQEAWLPYLDGVDRVYVVIEPDRGGEAVRGWLAKSALRQRAHLITLPPALKDPSGLYLSGGADPDLFRAAWGEAMAAAVPWAAVEREQTEAARRDAEARAAGLPAARRLLDTVVRLIHGRGLVGEERAVKLLYLVLTSRVLDKPVSAVMKGPSSAGKSFLVEQLLALFPEEACYPLSAMSERALAYSEEPLAHRTLVLYEAAGMAGEFGTYLMRSLLSEGRVRYETVDKAGDGMRARLIEREGPTNLLLTTTAVRLHPENETRLLSIPVTDTTDQTTAILGALGAEARGDVASEAEDLGPYRAYQEFLALDRSQVVIPYAAVLAALIPPVAVRLRRDFGAVLRLVRAHALLHLPIRRRDGQGRLVADIDDYAVVRELVADLLADTAEVRVATGVLDAVGAVKALCPDPERDAPVTAAQVARYLKVDRATASRHVATALDRGYLKDLEPRGGRPGRPLRLVVGDPLPKEQTILPEAEAVLAAWEAEQAGPRASVAEVQGVAAGGATVPPGERCSVAAGSGGIDPPPPPPTVGTNGTVRVERSWCPYPNHAPSDYRRPDGAWVCGVCHPSPAAPEAAAAATSAGAAPC